MVDIALGLLMFAVVLGVMGLLAAGGFSFWISEVEPYLEKKRNLK